MGELFLTREKYSEAVILFEDALSVYPQHIKAQFRVGFCRLNLGDYDRAEAAFSKTLKIDKKFKQANLFLARTAIAQNQEEKARNYYEQELKVNKNLQVAIEFAQFLKETGNIEEAEAILKEFQELYPEKGYITTSLANSPLIEPKREPNE
jgi:tetratricopeptide (TPR) repeat protein